jgi:ABC-type uncharacterized transport system ATPase component
MVTHMLDIAKFAERLIYLKDGEIIKECKKWKSLKFLFLQQF